MPLLPVQGHHDMWVLIDSMAAATTRLIWLPWDIFGRRYRAP
jgi:hypothetical protein